MDPKKTAKFTYCTLVLALLVTPAAAQVLPTGFFEDILVPGLTAPVGLAFLPDGRLLLIEQNTAAVKVWTGGATASLVGTVPGVESGGEQGLLAIAVDPGWPTRPYVYVWFNSSTTANMRLAMFTITGDLTNPASTNLVLGTQFNIVTDVPDNAGNHNGGTLRFGNDGMLYLSIGDDAGACNAQNTSSALGCVWRIDVSTLPGMGAGPPPKATLIPPGNPYAGPTDNDRLVWLHGLRNPFRFHVDSVTGFLYIADVGAGAWEEVSESTMGGQNLGWPWFEGNQAGVGCGGAVPATLAPFAVWSHANGGQAIISVGRYRNPPMGANNFGPGYEGDYFYLDYYAGAIRRAKFNGTSWVTPPAEPGQPNATDWATGYQTVSDALTGTDGAIYFVRQFGPGFSGPGSLRRIRSNPNATVVSVFSGNNQPGNAGLTLEHPLVARVATLGGTPVAGAAVTFVPTSGGGSTNPAVAITDAQGLAQTTYTLAPTFTGAAIVTASSPGSGGANFNAIWRGVVTNYFPLFSSLTVTVRHSQANSPVTLVWETPPAGAPYFATPWGDVWSSIVMPTPALGGLDGLGLLGPANPTAKTPPGGPTWVLSFPSLPIFGGITFRLQAYAIDTALYPAPESIMISNAPTLTLN